LPKEDRHLRIAPRFFDRDETPAIFVPSLDMANHLALIQNERKYYRRRRTAWALCCRQSAASPRVHGLTNARWQLVHGDSDPRRPKINSATLRCGDRGIRVGRLGFFKPFEDPEFLETAGLIRFGLEHNTPGEMVAIVEADGAAFSQGRPVQLDP
jgi:hypothetical protein